jgi:hypothetical protein
MLDPDDGGTETLLALIETVLTETLAVGCASPSRCTVSPRADRCGTARNARLTTALPTERCRLRIVWRLMVGGRRSAVGSMNHATAGAVAGPATSRS